MMAQRQAGGGGEGRQRTREDGADGGGERRERGEGGAFAGAGGPGSPGGPGGGRGGAGGRRNIATLWYLDEGGELQILPVRTGVSDGLTTEISPVQEGVELEGMEIISKVLTPSTNPQPQFGGRGGPGGGGFGGGGFGGGGGRGRGF